MTSTGFYQVCFSDGPQVVVAHFQKLQFALRYVERMGDACGLQIITPDGQRLAAVLRSA